MKEDQTSSTSNESDKAGTDGSSAKRGTVGLRAGTMTKSVLICIIVAVVLHLWGTVWINGALGDTNSLKRGYWQQNAAGEIAHTAVAIVWLIQIVAGYVFKYGSFLILPGYLFFLFCEIRERRAVPGGGESARSSSSSTSTSSGS